MRYRQDACYKCELPSCDAVAFKIHVQYLWNEAQILTSSSGAVYSSEKSMVQRGNSWTMSEMFSSSMLLASTCTPQCDHCRDTESTLPVGSCTPGMGGVQRVLLGKISAWVASSSEIFLLMELHSNCPGCIREVPLELSREGAAQVGIDSSFHLGLHVENVDCGQYKPQAHVCVTPNR